MSITPDQYAQALVKTFDRYITDPEHTIDVVELKEIVHSMFTGCSRNCLYSGRCEEFIGILPTGEIYLCDLFFREEHRVGYIDTITSEAIRNSAPARLIRGRSQHLLQTFCQGCQWWDICKGGCSSKSAAVYGDALREDPFCESRKVLFSRVRSYLESYGGKGVIQIGKAKRSQQVVGPCGTF